MFEDCLVESRLSKVSRSRRWTAIASIGLQVALVGVVIVLPTLHPEALSFSLEPPKVLLPLLPKPPAPPVRVQRITEAASVEASPALSHPVIVATMPRGRVTEANGEPSLVPVGTGMTAFGGLPIGIADGDGGPHPKVSMGGGRGPGKPLNVSTGVLQGMLLAPIRPVYPAIAKAAHIEGTVVVEATISRAGLIESLHVLSGPVMLQGAAIDAVRAARYRPYRLNGEATEVMTTITVNFRMGV